MRQDTVDRAVTGHVAALARGLDAAALAAHLAVTLEREVYPGFTDRPAAVQLLRASCDAKIRVLAQLLSQDGDPARVVVPEAIEFAHALARMGVPADTVERSYRVGQETVWQWWLDEVERHVAATGAPMAPILRATSPVMFGFVDRMLADTLEAYHGALEDQRRSVTDRRRRLVAQLLDGTVAAPSPEAERLLRYRLDGEHVAFAVADVAPAGCERLAQALHDALDGGGRLVVEDRELGGTVVWVRAAAELRNGVRAGVVRLLESSGYRVAIGEPADALTGFRRTREDACAAARVQRRLAPDGARVVWAADVRIETLGLAGAAAAARLVQRELAPLHDLDPVLRSTLEAWLTAGSNVGAAALLGVHEHTVRNRLRTVEALLGGGLHQRRTELHVALRLDAVLGDDSGAPG